MRWIALLVLAGCTDPVTFDGDTRLRAIVMQSPLCLLICNTKIDTIGSTAVGDTGSFTGSTISKTDTQANTRSTSNTQN